MKSTKWLGLLLVMAMLATVLAGCGGAATPTAAPAGADQPRTAAPTKPAAAANPVDAVEIKAPVTITFWHTQSAGRETAMKKIAADFTKANPNITVNLEYINGYTDLYKKMMASIQAGALPDLAVSYESMIADYATAKIVVPLDDYVNSTKYGLSKEDLADMPADMLEICRNPLLGNKLYTFPFTKSLLVMYYNADLLKAAGFDKPPATWDDFIKAAKAVTAGGKAKGYAAAMSASTFHGMILSRGGKLTSADFKAGNRNGPEGLAALQLISDGLKEGWAYYAKGYDWQNDFAAGKAAMALDSTSGLFFVPPLIKTPFNWGVAAMPQTARQQQQHSLRGQRGHLQVHAREAAGELALREVLRLAAGHGGMGHRLQLLPRPQVRGDRPGLQGRSGQEPAVQEAFALFKGGTKMVGEPNVAGEQDARIFVEDPMTGVLTGKIVTAADIKAALDAANKKITEAYVSKAQ